MRASAFSFPKSLYAVCESLKPVCLHRKDALILDFFAGSGTTLHAVNLLNSADGGKRQCILVTNNEVSEAESKSLRDAGFSWRQGMGVTWNLPICHLAAIQICDYWLTSRRL